MISIFLADATSAAPRREPRSRSKVSLLPVAGFSFPAVRNRFLQQMCPDLLAAQGA